MHFLISYRKNYFVCLKKLLKAETAACITAKTLPYTLFVVHPRVSKKIRNKIQKRILSWIDNAKSIIILAKANRSYFIKTRD